MPMNQIAFIFRQAPYGSDSGREGLDSLLATSAYSDQLAAFFMDDGIYQLLRFQQPESILAKDHSPMFKLCELYDIDSLYVLKASMVERNIDPTQLLIPVEILDSSEFYEVLAAYPIKLMF